MKSFMRFNPLLAATEMTLWWFSYATSLANTFAVIDWHQHRGPPRPRG